MMKLLLTSASVIAWLGCHAAQSQQVFGVPAAKDAIRGDIYYDCDAASGHTSQWSRTIEPAGSVTGTLFIREVRHDPEWAAFGGVMVSGPLPENLVGIEVTINGSATSLRAQLRYPKASPNAAAKRVELAHAPTGGMQFALQWQANTLRARVDPAGAWSEVPLPFKPERLWLACSTGNVVFHSVSVTTQVPAAPVEPKDHP
jgi:hypothetical protein